MLTLLLAACAPTTESAATPDSAAEGGLRSWVWEVDCAEPAMTSPPMPTDRPLIAQVVFWYDDDSNGVMDRATNSPYTLAWSDETGGGLSSADVCYDEIVMGGALTVLY